MSVRGQLAIALAAVTLAVWSAVPLAVVWDSLDIGYFSRAWQTWGWGTLVAALAASLLLVLSRGRVALWVLALWRRLMVVPSGLFVACAALALGALTAVFTLAVFSGNPRNVDGFAQLFQARIFLAGRLWMPSPEPLANFATLQMILGPDRWYSQYPPGQSLLLAAGLLLGAWWIFNPLIAALFAVCTWRVARWCTDESTARLTLVLLCTSPFVVAVAASEMSHLAAATLAMGAAGAAVSATRRRTPLYAGVAGLLLGLMTAFRPLDAVAAAGVVGLVLWLRAPGRAAALAISAAAGLAGALPTLWYNGQTTGSWRVFGYTALWGPQHSLGFHPVPFGVPLTLARAVARVGTDLHQLNTYLLDSTIPALLVVAVGYVAGRRLLQPLDAVPFVGVLSLMGLLFWYWHRDVFYGPRFLYSAVGWIVLLVARALVLLRRSGLPAAQDTGPAPHQSAPSATGHRPSLDPGLIATFVVLVSLVTGLVTITPGRIEAYRLSTPGFNLHPDRDAGRDGIHQAVVVIPDGWGSRLIARLWQAGIPVRRSTRWYAAIDACTLEQALAAAETTAADTGRSLPAILDSIAAEREPGVPVHLTDDRNLRLRPNTPIAAECRREIEVDRRGFYQFGPYLWLNAVGLDGDVVWARDLGPRNAALFRRYPGRRFYRFAPGTPGGDPVFLPLDGPGW